MSAADSGFVAFIVNGLSGAFLASLIAISVQWWLFPTVEWTYVKACAVFGFFVASIFGQRAIDFLGEIFRSW